MKVLVVCRGPVRKEAFDVFHEIGVREYGMLLSEKDTVVYPRCLAPELRSFRFPANVHRVPRLHRRRPGGEQERIREIVAIGGEHGYTHVFAGYGFMAEDADFVARSKRPGSASSARRRAWCAGRREGRGQEARARSATR